MDSVTKFDGIDYANTFAKKINVMPRTAGCLLMVSSEPEIALCNGGTAHENKKIFLKDMNKFIHKKSS